MTTSSQTRTATIKINDAHWQELTMTLSLESTECFDQWMDRRLSKLEDRLREFSSPQAIKKSLR